MAKFKCNNKKCSQHDIPVEVERCRWMWDSKRMKLVADIKYSSCPECGQEREELPKDWEGWNTTYRNPEKTYSKHSKGTIY